MNLNSDSDEDSVGQMPQALRDGASRELNHQTVREAHSCEGEKDIQQKAATKAALIAAISGNTRGVHCDSTPARVQLGGRQLGSVPFKAKPPVLVLPPFGMGQGSCESLSGAQQMWPSPPQSNTNLGRGMLLDAMLPARLGAVMAAPACSLPTQNAAPTELAQRWPAAKAAEAIGLVGRSLDGQSTGVADSVAAAADLSVAESHSEGGVTISSRSALAGAPQSCTLGSPQQPLPQSARGGADDQRLLRRSRRAPAPASLAAPAETPEPQAHAAATSQAATSQAPTSQAATSVIGEQPDNDDDSCAVCQEPEGFEDNPIVFCDGCNVGCHKECYGLSELPAGDWYCDRCKQSRSRQPSCPACPSREGVFKRTLGGRWGGLAHVACALYLPGCGFLPEGTMDKAAGFDLIPKNRGSLKCTLCPTIEAGRSGFKIQCSHKKCAVAFHVTCAQRAQLHMAIEDDGRDGTSMVTYCKKHTAENKAKSSAAAGSKATKGKKPRKRKRR